MPTALSNLSDTDLARLATDGREAGALAELLRREQLSAGDLISLSAFLLSRFDLVPRSALAAFGELKQGIDALELRLAILEQRLDEALAESEVAETEAEDALAVAPVTGLTHTDPDANTAAPDPATSRKRERSK